MGLLMWPVFPGFVDGCGCFSDVSLTEDKRGAIISKRRACLKGVRSALRGLENGFSQSNSLFCGQFARPNRPVGTSGGWTTAGI